MTRSRVLVVLATFAPAGAAVAQTTWSSFEDRANHALTTEFHTGMVAMFGGASTNGSGLLLDDTITRNNQTWQPQTPPSKPTGRKEHAMAGGLGPGDAPFVILFGGLKASGTGTVRSNDTWRYDGSSWGEVPVPTGARPAVRSGHGMVQDLLRNKVILIGGLGGIVPLGDVWEFDPVTDSWTQRLPAAPVMPGRFGHAMAWDPVTGNVLVFGGSGYRQDTWEYNPVANTWTNRTPAGPNPVPGRVNASMAYHPLADRIVLFGGATATGVLDDTWVWDRNTSTWQPTTPTTRPPGRRGQAMTPEQDGSVVLVHGGTDGAGNTLRGTWAWTGSDWTTNFPPPSPRKGAAMAYDGARGRHVLFGGRIEASGLDSNETWELDGLSWRRRTTANAPSARSAAGVAHDSRRGRTVLFGGRTGGACGAPLGDTWEWDGTNWQARTTAIAPPADAGMQMVFDTNRNVVWNPVAMSSGHLGMWSWNGLAWAPDPSLPPGSCAAAYDSARGQLIAIPATASGTTSTRLWAPQSGWTVPVLPLAPPARGGHGMAYDSARQQVVLFGGYQPSTGTIYGDTWIWDGASWTPGSGPSPSPRYGGVLVFDPLRDRMVLFGGIHDLNYLSLSNETWEWDGTAWTQRNPALSPSPRGSCAGAFDPGRGRLVIVCGEGPNFNYGATAQTWEYDGSSWTNRTSGAHPSPRTAAAAQYDPHSGAILLYGGYDGTTRGDMWSWNGIAWTQLAPSASPGTRVAWGSFVRIGTRPTLVGGYRSAPSAVFSDLWEWQGQAWAQIDPGPLAQRTGFGAAYDKRRDRTVLFGGRTSCNGAFLDETWEWNGGSWRQMTPANKPSPRAYCQMSYDEARSRIVLIGGSDATLAFSDTWEWDGNDWSLRLPAASPPSVDGHAVAYDAHRRVTVISSAVGTWDYGPTFPASIAPYGQGCQGTAGVPELRPTPWAGPWLGDRMEIDILRRPPGFGLMVYGFSDTLWNGLPLPLPISALGIPAGNGCTLQSSVEWSEFLPFSGRYTSFPMPTLPIALGFTMHMQAGFLDAGTPGFPVVVSQGLHITFGAK